MKKVIIFTISLVVILTVYFFTKNKKSNLTKENISSNIKKEETYQGDYENYYNNSVSKNPNIKINNNFKTNNITLNSDDDIRLEPIQKIYNIWGNEKGQFGAVNEPESAFDMPSDMTVFGDKIIILDQVNRRLQSKNISSESFDEPISIPLKRLPNLMTINDQTYYFLLNDSNGYGLAIFKNGNMQEIDLNNYTHIKFYDFNELIYANNKLMGRIDGGKYQAILDKNNQIIENIEIYPGKPFKNKFINTKINFDNNTIEVSLSEVGGNIIWQKRVNPKHEIFHTLLVDNDINENIYVFYEEGVNKINPKIKHTAVTKISNNGNNMSTYILPVTTKMGSSAYGPIAFDKKSMKVIQIIPGLNGMTINTFQL